jgi:hypothetical protein
MDQRGFEIGDRVNVRPEGEGDTDVGPGKIVAFPMNDICEVLLDNGVNCYPLLEDVELLAFFHAIEDDGPFVNASPADALRPGDRHCMVPEQLTRNGNPAQNPNPKKAFGATKPDLALVPPVGTLHQAMAHELGAKKYGAFNWRQDPVENMTYIAAAMRHLQAYLDGEDYTSDSEGLVHNLGAVMAGCAIVLDSLELGILIDNRPLPGKASAVQERIQGLKRARTPQK